MHAPPPDDLDLLLRNGAPAPQAPAWLAARTLARLRRERETAALHPMKAFAWARQHRWVLAVTSGAFLLLIASLSMFAPEPPAPTHAYSAQERATFAALDLLLEQGEEFLEESAL